MVSTPERKNKAKPLPPKSSEELVAMFDRGEDVSGYIDVDNAVQRVNVDFPVWMVALLDREAARLQVPRQAIIKIWIDDRLKAEARQRRGGEGAAPAEPR